MYKFTLSIMLLLTAPSLGCPDLWVAVGDSCYKESPVPMTWYQADQYCASEGGYLIEIGDENEQASLLGFLNYELFYWIGLTDLAKEGTWVWQTNHEEASYTFWASGEPDNAGDNEDCAHLWNFVWNDAGCELIEASGNPIHALCEMENEKEYQYAAN